MTRRRARRSRAHGIRASTDATSSRGARACASCAAQLHGSYCSSCGEKALDAHDRTLRGVVHDALHTLFHFDGKVVRSIAALVRRPGLLTAEYRAGRRNLYAKPLALFVFVNIVFFIVQPHTGLFSYRLRNYAGEEHAPRPTLQRAMVDEHLAATGETLEVYRARFDQQIQLQKKSMMIFCVPLFALALSVLYGFKQSYVDHLVFAVHYFAWRLIMLVLIAAVGSVFVLAARGLGPGMQSFGGWFGSEAALTAALFVVSTVCVAIALRRAFGGAPGAAIARAVLLFLVDGGLIVAYRSALFFTTFHAL